ncbi:class I SAM-dependent methyltransferase [Kitasatospora indigofera]|uniref:class I SAM-dependent methyltransferase n=1 Tax=Kitasatospora indigofera TaxID=67307 RepID=UPI003673BFE8
MALARLLHGDPQHDTAGSTIDHGRGYEVFTDLAFGGRRNHVFARLVELSAARPGDHVLDVGCGTGYLTRRVAQAVAPGGTALGVDPSTKVIAHARRLAEQDGRDNCTFRRGIAEELDAPAASFDAVVSSLMVHHLPAALRQRALAEIHRVLRPGGRLMVADFRPPRGRIGRHLVGAVTGPAMELNPIGELEGLVRQAGFEDVATGDLHPWIHYVTATKPAVRSAAAT